jgi:hypothetical protein
MSDELACHCGSDGRRAAAAIFGYAFPKSALFSRCRASPSSLWSARFSGSHAGENALESHPEIRLMFTSLARVLPLVGALIALLPAAASAHGPTRQKVVTKIEINAPVEKVWAAVGNFQDMSWHPLFKKTEGTGGNDPGATRTLTLESGAKIEEKLGKRSEEERSLQYEITKVDVKDVPVSNYSSTIIVSGTPEKSIVEWRGAFYRGYVNNDPPPELSDEAAVAAINKVYQTGLGALKAQMEKGGS